MAGMSELALAMKAQDETVAGDIIDALEAAGYRVIAPSAALDDSLLNRMESFAGDLQILSGMTRRGGVLPQSYRADDLPAIRRMAIRLLDALATGEAVHHPWDKVDV